MISRKEGAQQGPCIHSLRRAFIIDTRHMGRLLISHPVHPTVNLSRPILGGTGMQLIADNPPNHIYRSRCSYRGPCNCGPKGAGAFEFGREIVKSPGGAAPGRPEASRWGELSIVSHRRMPTRKAAKWPRSTMMMKSMERSVMKRAEPLAAHGSRLQRPEAGSTRISVLNLTI